MSLPRFSFRYVNYRCELGIVCTFPVRWRAYTCRWRFYGAIFCGRDRDHCSIIRIRCPLARWMFPGEMHEYENRDFSQPLNRSTVNGINGLKHQVKFLKVIFEYTPWAWQINQWCVLRSVLCRPACSTSRRRKTGSMRGSHVEGSGPTRRGLWAVENGTHSQCTFTTNHKK